MRLYCFSEERAAKERGIAERFARRFESALTELSEGLSKPRTGKRLDQVWQRIGRLKENSRGIAQHYDIELDTDESGQRATAVRFIRRPLSGTMMTHPGVYCLRSSETDWDESTLWRTYFMPTDLEAVFRSLKSELGLRPCYHHKPIRADGHLFITVSAYQLVQVLRTRLRQAGVNRAGPRYGAPSKHSSASLRPSVAPTGAPYTCARPRVPHHPNRRSTTHWVSIPPRDGSARRSCNRSSNTHL